jgi:hypothetical protein
VFFPNPSYGVDAPLFWYLRQMARAEGQTVVIGETPADLAGAELVVAMGETVGAVAAAASHTRAVWLAPWLTEPAVAEALTTAEAPSLVVGSLVDPTWDRQVAARLRRAEVLQLSTVDELLQSPASPEQSMEIVGKVVERARALVRGPR